MAWVHAIGAYLVAGTALQGLGWIARTRWIASGKIKPIPKHARFAVWLGLVVGVLFWPVVLTVLLIGWQMRRRTRKMERFLGFCEHATAWEPYCGPCRRELDREDTRPTTIFRVGQSIGEMEAEMDRRCREAVAAFVSAHPECPKCWKIGTLSQYLDSIWVKCSSCGRRIFTPDPSVPEEVDMAPAWPVEGTMVEAASFYDCSICGTRSEGFPPGTDAEGRPLCVACKIAHLRTQK